MGILLTRGSILQRIYSSFAERRLYPTYGLALTRIGYAFAILITLVTNLSHWKLLWGEDRPWAGADTSTVAPFNYSNSLILAVIALCFSGSLSMLVGFYSRTSVLIAWASYFSLMRSDPLVTDGGDNVLQICLLFLAFTRCGDRLSIDVLRFNPGYPTGYPRLFSNGAWLLIVIQTMILYATAGLSKVAGESWRSGEAIAFTLKSVEYSPWPALNEWISELHTPLVLAAYATVLLQVYFPFLVLNRLTKGITIGALIVFHASIGLLMGLTSFAIVMIATEMCLVSDKFFERVLEKSTRLRKLIPSTQKAPSSTPP